MGAAEGMCCDGTVSSTSPGSCRPYINFWTYSSGTDWPIAPQAAVAACQTPKRAPSLRAMESTTLDLQAGSTEEEKVPQHTEPSICFGGHLADP